MKIVTSSTLPPPSPLPVFSSMPLSSTRYNIVGLTATLYTFPFTLAGIRLSQITPDILLHPFHPHSCRYCLLDFSSALSITLTDRKRSQEESIGSVPMFARVVLTVFQISCGLLSVPSICFTGTSKQIQLDRT